MLCPLQAGDWENGSKLLKHLTDLGVDPVAFPAIAKALCKLAREYVAPTYKGLYPDGLRGQCILARKVRTCTPISVRPHHFAVASLRTSHSRMGTSSSI